MGPAPETQHAEADQILFALESFELTDRDRLEVSGRWFGVRGRRFVRPTLTVRGKHQRSRWLADLEHKPWSAEDGESWVASFPFELDGQEVRELELAVAPDIAITLPAPASLGERDHDRGEALIAVRDMLSGGEDSRLARPVAAHAPYPAPSRELDALRKRLDEQRKHVAELRGELERAGVTKTELTSALTRRDAAVRKFDALVRERDEALRERDQAIGERDDAMRRRDRTIDAIDEAVARRELALREADEARRERDGALRERQTMMRALTRMRAERDEAVSRRNAALERIERVQAKAKAEIAELRSQLEREHDAAAVAEREIPPRPPPAERHIPPRPAPAEREIPPRPAPAEREIPSRPRPAALRVPRRGSHRVAFVWARRAFAVVVLLAAITAIVLIIHSP